MGKRKNDNNNDIGGKEYTYAFEKASTINSGAELNNTSKKLLVKSKKDNALRAKAW